MKLINLSELKNNLNAIRQSAKPFFKNQYNKYSSKIVKSWERSSLRQLSGASKQKAATVLRNISKNERVTSIKEGIGNYVADTRKSINAKLAKANHNRKFAQIKTINFINKKKEQAFDLKEQVKQDWKDFSVNKHLGLALTKVKSDFQKLGSEYSKFDNNPELYKKDLWNKAESFIESAREVYLAFEKDPKAALKEGWNKSSLKKLGQFVKGYTADANSRIKDFSQNPQKYVDNFNARLDNLQRQLPQELRSFDESPKKYLAGKLEAIDDAMVREKILPSKNLEQKVRTSPLANRAKGFIQKIAEFRDGHTVNKALGEAFPSL